MKAFRIALPVIVGCTLALQPVVAGASTAVTWQLNEAPHAGRMHSAGGGPDGHIGAHVITGVATDTSSGYRFPRIKPGADDARLVTVPDAPALDPGSARITVTVRLKTSGTGEYNVIQKGQAPDRGFYKIQVNASGRSPGIPTCTFGDGGNRLSVLAGHSKVNDGRWHVLACSKSTSASGNLVATLTVDGHQTTKTFSTSSYPLGNSESLSIGGKIVCNGASIDCDYFYGLLDWASVRIG